MYDEEYIKIKKLLDDNADGLNYFCYKTNNRFAYMKDRDNIPPESESKAYNFTPTYDKWCLYCDDKNCKLRCSSCKTVYFCDVKCQKKAWPIHKNHCKRNLFCVCITCGRDNTSIVCDRCPVKYCSISCRTNIEADHKAYDCETFSKLFS